MNVETLPTPPLFYADLTKRGHGNRSTIWRRVQQGIMPKPRYFAGHACWTVAQIREVERCLWSDGPPATGYQHEKLAGAGE